MDWREVVAACPGASRRGRGPCCQLGGWGLERYQGLRNARARLALDVFTSDVIETWINYKMKNTSQNLFSVDIIMLGESYHNNHHKFPSNINFGKRWHELDPIYPIIRALDWMKVIKIKKVAPVAVHAHAGAEPVMNEW